jgi:hypothetical protein
VVLVLKQVTSDTHANVQVKAKRTRTVEANYNAHANFRLEFKRTSPQRELGWTKNNWMTETLILGKIAAQRWIKELKEYSCLTYKTITVGWHVLGLERSGAWKKASSTTETHWDRAWANTRKL